MFENLSERFTGIVKRLRGESRLTEDNIDGTLREVRLALLEADVALPVVTDFLARVRVRALGQEVIGTLTPGQALIRVVRDELTTLMGEAGVGLDFNAQPPVVILLAGLQGSGKTTTAAKLAKRLKEQDRKAVAVAVAISTGPQLSISCAFLPAKLAWSVIPARKPPLNASPWRRWIWRGGSSKMCSSSTPPAV